MNVVENTPFRIPYFPQCADSMDDKMAFRLTDVSNIDNWTSKIKYENGYIVCEGLQEGEYTLSFLDQRCDFLMLPSPFLFFCSLS